MTACIHKHVKASPEELMEAMNGKLSLEDRFLLDQSLEDVQMAMEKELEKKTLAGILKDAKANWKEAGA